MRKHYDFSKGRRFNQDSVVLHECQACGHKWSELRNTYSCPKCEYSEPFIRDSKIEVITKTRVKTREGKIVCHLVQPEV